MRLLALITTLTFALFNAGAALAFPPLPSSFYGYLTVNGANVPDGTLVRALIDDQVYAEGRTQTFEGRSVYSLNVLGDDSDTPTKDGGVEGETIHFEIGGLLAAETALWHGGTNASRDLSAAGVLAASVPTVPPAPSQTPIAVANVAPVPPTENPGPAERSLPLAAVAVILIAVLISAVYGAVRALRPASPAR